MKKQKIDWTGFEHLFEEGHLHTNITVEQLNKKIHGNEDNSEERQRSS